MMKKFLLIIGIFIIWGNTLCAQITVNSRTEKRDFVNLHHKKRDSSFLYRKVPFFNEWNKLRSRFYSKITLIYAWDFSLVELQLLKKL